MYHVRRGVSPRSLGTGAAALALAIGLAGTAQAGERPGGRGWDDIGAAGYTADPNALGGSCEFSLDGEDWRGKVRVSPGSLRPAEDGTVGISVRAGSPDERCVASLASYRTHGATWRTSGKQEFHDWATVTVTGDSVGSLRIAVPDTGCFAQVDLYRGSVKFDGRLDARDGLEHGELPEGPHKPVIKDRKIAAWNGGSRECPSLATPGPAPSSSESAPGAPGSSSDADPVPSGPASAGSADGGSPVPDHPAADETSGAPAPPAAAPPRSLAETGGGGVSVYAALGTLLLAAGGGVVILVVRRGRRTTAG
ncbi:MULTISPECIES: hypothetical protein [unclassified Streptomyces]|uniref:hypothetical protein n=1 Tax=unclassified Streptomyces TaxID=2593676 RepID=UPI00382DD98E